MLKTYFFIPATEKKFINKIPQIKASEFVLDLEDAIAENQINLALENISLISNKDELLVRPRLFSSSGKLKHKNLEPLIDMGFRRFFIPKASTPETLDELLNVFKYYEIKNLEWYYLIESPQALMHLKEVALSQKYPFKGLCFGSQDYAAEMNLAYSLESISWARHYILNVAKACNLEAIDMASMTLKNKQLFEKECKQAFDMGYDAKLVIHPAQLKVIEELDYYTTEEIERTKKLAAKVDINELKDFSVITIDGILYERPHIARIRKVLEYINKREKHN